MSGDQHTAVHIEGGLLPVDLISRIAGADRELPGNKPETYHLGSGERLGEAASRKWEYLLGVYDTFRKRLIDVPETESGASETRERWLLRLLDELSYGRVPYNRGGLSAEGMNFPVSHLWEHVPIHLVGWRTDLDDRAVERGGKRRAPQSMLQEFLNKSDDHLWGVLSNGRRLRILRDSASLVGSSYIEFDLEAIFDGELYSDFVLLYALLHSSRVELLPRDDGEAPAPADCWLERWRTHAIETGTRARKQLRTRVQHALDELGTGFLELNPALRENLAAGRLSLGDFHHELLRLAYQLVFLFVAEDRGALLEPVPGDAPEGERAAYRAAHERYAEYFSTARLRRIAARRRGDNHGDLWRTLVIVLDALGSDDGCPELALPPIGGLFFRAGDPLAADLSPDMLRPMELSNARLLAAVRLLSNVPDRKGRPHRIDYRHLDAEELGSIYESLLELEARHDPAEPRFWLEKLPGNQRKTSGTYFTPPPLVNELLKTTIDPVIAEYAESGDPDDLLKITVCDPACGSGHFLVAAARRIAKKYAAMATGDEEPTPKAVREAMHKVVARCIYGVDLKPLAAELTKVSLWMESLEPGKPLAFLDSHIKVGNSLLGTTPALLDENVPDRSFKPIEGDDRTIVSALKKQNATERAGQKLRGGQDMLFDESYGRVGNVELAEATLKLAAMPIRALADIREQARRLREVDRSPEKRHRKLLADAWCAAFVWRKHADAPPAITSATLRTIESAEAKLREDVARELAGIVEKYGFFHWHIEFPDIFRVDEHDDRDANPDTGWSGGFTCVLGNPPWERVKIQEKEFFAGRDEDIEKAPNASARKKLIAALASSDSPSDRNLYAVFMDELRTSAGWSHLLRDSGRYPLTGQGDVNTYSVFAETARTVVAPKGRSGMVLPTGIATDATTAPFFGDLVRTGNLVAFLEFENEEFVLSEDVHHSFRFCLISMGGRRVHVNEAAFAFGSRSIADIEPRRFTMPPDEILLLNPNTGTAPLFRSRRDAEITLGVYRRIPVLWKENPEENPWGLSFMAMFHMANDSGIFHTRDELESSGWRLDGNVFVRESERMLPLYEAKMIHHFDHRLGTYEGQTQAQANMGTLPRLTVEEKQDPSHVTVSRYWVAKGEVDAKLKGRWNREWLLGWRDIARSTDERTVISTAIPRSAVGDKFLLAMAAANGPLLQANLSAMVLDYCARQKFAGTSLKYYLIKQLPIIPPSRYEEVTPWRQDVKLARWMCSRILELTYTALDMTSFADDLGDSGAPFVWDENRRFWIRAELDAAYFHLYGINRGDMRHIVGTFKAFHNNDPERFARTRDAIIEIYDSMARATAVGESYQTILDPPPGQGSRCSSLS